MGRTMKRLSLTAWIFIAMLVGVAFGAAFPDTAKADWVAALANVFLRLIKSIIAPLIFGTLVYGIASTGSVKVRKIGRRDGIATGFADALRHTRAHDSGECDRCHGPW
jgi:proton glutamate symport protein